jgi:hypothetical protein
MTIGGAKARAYNYAIKNSIPCRTSREHRLAVRAAWLAGYRSAIRARRKLRDTQTP